jgi:hypothetical protein
MRTKYSRTALFFLPFSIVAAHAAPIQNLTFTEVVKDVFVIDPATKKETPAKAGDKLLPPNVLKTGADSRAELVAEDKTVTRVGSNTIFSVEANSRDVNLAQGSVLLHTPSGRGGGRIKSAGATASVLGTTLAVSANPDGGFKTSLLEGKGEVKDPKGAKVGLVAGQVTFAKPGGGLSPALNFDLRAQISNSKLVGGFSTPIASIAKIEAAVAVQQAKIAGGGLVSTGMLIGDRPDTAFKVDSTIVDGQIRQAQTRRIEQENATKETKTFYEVDPRYLQSVLQTVHLSLDPLQNLNKPDQLPKTNYSFYNDQTAPGEHVFVIDRTGRASLAPEIENAIGGVPRNLPGNLQDTSVTYHALIANEIVLNISPTTLGTIQNAKIDTVALENSNTETRLTLTSPGDLPSWVKPGVMLSGAGLPAGTIVSSISGGVAILSQSPTEGNHSGAVSGMEVPEFFLPIPLTEKVGGALVARQNLDLSGAIEFVGVDNIETTPDGYETGQTLLLSAGNTLKIKPGSMLVANTSLFEIYAGGTSFAGDLSLALKPLAAGETATPLELERVAIINKFPLDTDKTSNGAIRITAPEIHLKDAMILAASESSEIQLTASGAISISTSALPAPPSGLLLNLGVSDVKDLCVKAFKVGIQSSSKTVSINGVSLFANDVTLRSGDELTLTSVVIDPFDFQREQTLTASAAKNVTIDSGTLIGMPQSRSVPAVVSTRIYSDNGDIFIKGTEFGSPYDPSAGTDPKTTFTAQAPNGNITLTSANINADNVFFNPLEQDPLKPETVLFNGKSVTFEGVNIAPTDSQTGSIQVNSRGDLNVSKGATARANSFTAFKIVFDAKNDMILTDLAVTHPVSNDAGNAFRATAARQLELSRVSLSQAQVVALDAQTVVLSEVQFKADSNLSITSKDGILSTPTDRNGITTGWINVLPKVMYGTYDLNRLSDYMGAHGAEVPGAATRGITATKFSEVVQAVRTDKNVDLTKIQISAKAPK